MRSGKSICLLGRPGVGKTTMLRECARILSEDRNRVVIVDTSNEIAGDGDMPHPGIGHARRMQVSDPALQHDVMIEAVENHMPQVIVIDEIGTEAEALAARTIAERGVQLIGTAHGQTLENLLMNPTLSDLVGGISAVTLSDEEARRRGTRKTVLERKAPPTFEVVIEIVDRDRLAIHNNVADVVDALLARLLAATRSPAADARRHDDRRAGGRHAGRRLGGGAGRRRARRAADDELLYASGGRTARDAQQPLSIFPYGVSRNKIERAIQNLRVNANIARKWDDADVVLTLKALERKESTRLKQIASENVPIYSIKTNTTTQIQWRLKDVFNLPSVDAEELALREAEEAVYQVLLGTKPSNCRRRPRTFAGSSTSWRKSIACSRAARASSRTGASRSSAPPMPALSAPPSSGTPAVTFAAYARMMQSEPTPTQLLDAILTLRDAVELGFTDVRRRLDEHDRRFDQIDLRFEAVDRRFEQIDRRFEAVDRRFEQIERRFEGFEEHMNQRFDLLELRFDRLEKRVDRIELR